LQQRVIREEGLFKSTLELLYGAPMGWWDNLVHLHRCYFQAIIRLHVIAGVRLHGMERVFVFLMWFV
jgi:hypothetical protein